MQYIILFYPLSPKPNFGRKKKVFFFRKFYSFSFYAREKCLTLPRPLDVPVRPRARSAFGTFV